MQRQHRHLSRAYVTFQQITKTLLFTQTIYLPKVKYTNKKESILSLLPLRWQRQLVNIEQKNEKCL